MPTLYKVERGDCIGSIAAHYGFLPETIWNDPSNMGLRQMRGKQHILFEGDQVLIPDRRVGERQCPTNKCHRFVLRSAMHKLRIALLDESNQPRSGVVYVVQIDGKLNEGKTGADGVIELRIPANANKGILTLGEDYPKEEYDLHLGHLDPVTELCGVKMRLNNLGFYSGDPDQPHDDITRRAICSFQDVHKLPVTGEIDDVLRSQLVSEHGS